MRRFPFGWICNLRGFHYARRPKQAFPLSGFLLFRCVCSAKKLVAVDVQRGGRIPVPYSWSLTNGQTEVEAAPSQGPKTQPEPLVQRLRDEGSTRIQKEGTGTQGAVAQAGEGRG